VRVADSQDLRHHFGFLRLSAQHPLEEDTLSDAHTTSPPPIAGPEEIDVDWIEAALEPSGLLAGRSVSSFSSEMVGTGQMGRSVRLNLDLGADPPPTTSVVVKLPSDDPTSRATGAGQGSYMREVRFYQELALDTPMRTPRCHFAAIDEASPERFTLVLEDMAQSRQGDQIAGCTPEEAALALDELTGLHAPWWGSERLPGLAYLQQSSPESAPLLQGVYQALQPGFEARYADRLGSDAMDLTRRFGGQIGPWAAAFTGTKTLTHGDYRLDNMLFGTTPESAPLCIVDWQTVGFGAALGDAAYFLGAGLSIEDRRVHEDALLHRYHDGLLARGVEGYDWNACHRDYRLFTFAGVIMAVVASMIVESTERGDTMFLAMAERHATHALDVGAFDLLD